MTVVGVIGLGDIGRGVANAVSAAGLDLIVFDVRPEAVEAFADRAKVASGSAKLAAEADITVVAVVNDEQVRSVLDPETGGLSRARPGSTVVIVATVEPSTVRSLADAAARAGVGVVDCGVSGGPSAAAEGNLVSMVGGDDADIEKAMPALTAFSSLVVRMGALGSGLQAKLARNVVQYGSWFAAFEAQRLAEAAGVDLARLAEVIRASDKKIGGAATLMFRSTAAPFGAEDDAGLVGAMRSAAALAHKDLRAAMRLGAELGVELPLATLVDTHMDSVFGMGSSDTGPA